MLLGFGESSASAAAIYGDETACGARNSVEREGGMETDTATMEESASLTVRGGRWF